MFVKLIKESTINWKIWKYLIPTDFLGMCALLLLGKDFFELSIKCSAILGVAIILSIWVIRFLYLCF